jgi:hypothetical protein
MCFNSEINKFQFEKKSLIAFFIIQLEFQLETQYDRYKFTTFELYGLKLIPKLFFYYLL